MAVKEALQPASSGDPSVGTGVEPEQATYYITYSAMPGRVRVLYTTQSESLVDHYTFSKHISSNSVDLEDNHSEPLSRNQKRMRNYEKKSKPLTSEEFTIMMRRSEKSLSQRFTPEEIEAQLIQEAMQSALEFSLSRGLSQRDFLTPLNAQSLYFKHAESSAFSSGPSLEQIEINGKQYEEKRQNRLAAATQAMQEAIEKGTATPQIRNQIVELTRDGLFDRVLQLLPSSSVLRLVGVLTSLSLLGTMALGCTVSPDIVFSGTQPTPEGQEKNPANTGTFYVIPSGNAVDQQIYIGNGVTEESALRMLQKDVLSQRFNNNLEQSLYSVQTIAGCSDGRVDVPAVTAASKIGMKDSVVFQTHDSVATSNLADQKYLNTIFDDMASGGSNTLHLEAAHGPTCGGIDTRNALETNPSGVHAPAELKGYVNANVAPGETWNQIYRIQEAVSANPRSLTKNIVLDYFDHVLQRSFTIATYTPDSGWNFFITEEQMRGALTPDGHIDVKKLPSSMTLSEQQLRDLGFSDVDIQVRTALQANEAARFAELQGFAKGQGFQRINIDTTGVPLQNRPQAKNWGIDPQTFDAAFKVKIEVPTTSIPREQMVQLFSDQLIASEYAGLHAPLDSKYIYTVRNFEEMGALIEVYRNNPSIVQATIGREGRTGGIEILVDDSVGSIYETVAFTNEEMLTANVDSMIAKIKATAVKSQVVNFDFRNSPLTEEALIAQFLKEGYPLEPVKAGRLVDLMETFGLDNGRIILGGLGFVCMVDYIGQKALFNTSLTINAHGERRPFFYSNEFYEGGGMNSRGNDMFSEAVNTKLTPLNLGMKALESEGGIFLLDMANTEQLTAEWIGVNAEKYPLAIVQVTQAETVSPSHHDNNNNKGLVEFKIIALDDPNNQIVFHYDHATTQIQPIEGMNNPSLTVRIIPPQQYQPDDPTKQLVCNFTLSFDKSFPQALEQPTLRVIPNCVIEPKISQVQNAKLQLL